MARLLGIALVLVAAMAQLASGVGGGHDYGRALGKSILYFEAQRSGVLPQSQRIAWRANSGLADGKANGVDLVGGYYDAGDNVKFGLPMAFTVTMMAWSVIEYGEQMAAAGELGHAVEAIKWGTDYFAKAHPEPNVLYAEKRVAMVLKKASLKGQIMMIAFLVVLFIILFVLVFLT